MIQVTKQFQKKSSEYLALTQKKQQRIGKLGAIWNIPPPPLPRTVGSEKTTFQKDSFGRVEQM